MTAPLVCPNCDKPTDHDHYYEPGQIGIGYACKTHDWRAEALSRRGDYERGFQDALVGAASAVWDSIKDRVANSRPAGGIAAATAVMTFADQACNAIRALQPRRAP